MKLPKIEIIKKIVSEHFGYASEVVFSRDRKSGLVKARHSAIYITSVLTWYGRMEIAEAYKMNVSNISYILSTVEDFKSVDPRFAKELEELKQKCEQAI